MTQQIESTEQRSRVRQWYSMYSGWLIAGGVMFLALCGSITLLYMAVRPDSTDSANEFTRTVVQILGGAALFGSLFFTYQTLRENQQANRERERLTAEANKLNLDALLENQKANRERERLTQESHITDRFTKAVEQLGSERLEVRIGGIFTLERISKESQHEYWTVLEILTAYVRERSRWDDSQPPAGAWFARQPDGSMQPEPFTLGTDTKAVLTILARRDHYKGQGEDTRLDLSRTDLRSAIWTNAHLEEASFIGSQLSVAVFFKCHLRKTKFDSSLMYGTHFLGKCDLEGASFAGATLRNSQFHECNLTNASFGYKDRPTNVEGVGFQECTLDGADFRWAINLTSQQLAAAASANKLLLPNYLQN